MLQMKEQAKQSQKEEAKMEIDSGSGSSLQTQLVNESVFSNAVSCGTGQ